MPGYPSFNLFRAGALRPVRADVYEGYLPVLGGEKPDRIAPPCGRKHDLGAGAVEQLVQSPKELLIDNVRELARIGGLIAV